MKKFFSQVIASLVITGMSMPFGGALIAYAVGQPYATVSVDSTEGNPCLGTDLTITGGGEINPAGQISQYKIQVVWGPAGIFEEEIPITLTNASEPYTYTFSAGPHTYTATPPATVTVKIYHSRSSGGDAQADSETTIPTCPPNEHPVITTALDPVTIPEMEAYTFDVDATDPEGDTLHWSLVGQPAGMTIDESTGEISWTPAEEQGPGTYSFDIVVSDLQNETTGSFEITVDEVNVAPVATSSNVSTSLNTDKDIVLGGSDSDIPTNGLTYEIVSGPNHGTLGAVSGNQVTYTPDTDYVGSDSFTFKIVDDGEPSLESNEATVSITISNDAPSLEAIDEQFVDEGTNLSVAVSATDPNDDPLEFSLGANTLPEGNTATADPLTGEFNWTPGEQDGPGVYSVTITVTDGAATDSQTFIINVAEVNEAPVAHDGTAELDEDTALDITVSGTDSDLPAQSLSYELDTLPTSGTATIDGDVVTYIPNANFNGVDTFTFVAFDGEAYSTPATVIITVFPVNDAPTIELIGDDSVTFTQGGTFNDPGATCSDIDGEELTPEIDQGSFDSETPGSYTFTYTCTDNDGASAETTRTVVVSAIPVNNPPVISSPDNFATIEITQGDDFNDPASAASDIEDGDLTPDLVITGSVDTSTPGTYVLTYMVTDSGGATAQETRTVVVKAPRKSGGSSGSIPNGGSSQGRVLGAETSCGIYVENYLRKGYANNRDTVIKLQQFLNDYMQAGLATDGQFGPKTEQAVKNFQTKHADQILTPWKLTAPTGIVYLTTVTTINNIMCPDLGLTNPANLVPWSMNPTVGRKQ